MGSYKFNNDKLKWEKQSSTFIYLPLLLLVVTINIYQLSINRKVYKFVEGEKISIVKLEKEEFSPKLLKSYLKEINMPHADIVYAQMVLETGHFKSTIFKENNNLCGMKCARSRIYTHKGSNRGHAYYENWKMSAIDYALYSSSYLRDLKTDKQYFKYLGEHYAEDKNYVSKLKTIINKEK